MQWKKENQDRCCIVSVNCQASVEHNAHIQYPPLNSTYTADAKQCYILGKNVKYRHRIIVYSFFTLLWTYLSLQNGRTCVALEPRLRFFGRIRKRICDPRSYRFFDTKKKTQNPKKDYFVMTRQAGGTQYLCQNDISQILPQNSTRMYYKLFRILSQKNARIMNLKNPDLDLI